MRTCDRALELKRTNRSAWRKLPAQLRSQAEEAEKLMAAQHGKRIQVDPTLTHGARESGRAIHQAVEQIDPKIRGLAKRDAALANLPFPKVQAAIPFSEAVMKYIKVPGMRGRPTKKDTPKLVEQVRELLEQGITQWEITKRHFWRPDEDFDKAYSRVRAFVRDHGLTPRRR
jgi:RNA processing factor Prp31